MELQAQSQNNNMNKESTKQYIYIFTNPKYTGLVKIGKTKLHPEVRADKLSRETSGIGTFDVEWSQEVSNHSFYESIIHRYLRNYREEKEFFKLEINDAIRHVELIVNTLDAITEIDNEEIQILIDGFSDQIQFADNSKEKKELKELVQTYKAKLRRRDKLKKEFQKGTFILSVGSVKQYIYMLSYSKDLSLIKIGGSAKHPEEVVKRLNRFDGNLAKFYVLWYQEVRDFKFDSKLINYFLQDFNEEKDFFKINEEDAKRKVDFILKITQTLSACFHKPKLNEFKEGFEIALEFSDSDENSKEESKKIKGFIREFEVRIKATEVLERIMK